MALGKIKKENIDVIQACISIHSSNKKKKAQKWICCCLDSPLSAPGTEQTKRRRRDVRVKTTGEHGESKA